MFFHVLTLFPDMIRAAMGESILGRAAGRGLIKVDAVDIRSFTEDRHGSVDDYTYGGGAGMLMQAQPVYDCCSSVQAGIRERSGKNARVLYMSPRGRVFDQKMAREFAAEEDLILLCGHYEGVDARALEEIGAEEVSVGDFVLTGGELPALVIIDAVSRMIPGVLGNSGSADTDSFMNGLLEYPQYSRPAVWRGIEVPAVLLSGDHAKVDEWRLEQSIQITRELRPDLFARFEAEHPEILEERRKRLERQRRSEERRRRREQRKADKEDQTKRTDEESRGRQGSQRQEREERNTGKRERKSQE